MRAVTYIGAADVMAAVGCSRSTAYQLLHAAGAVRGKGLLRVSSERWESFARERFEEAKSAAEPKPRRARERAAAPAPKQVPRLRLVVNNSTELRPTQPRRRRTCGAS